MLVLIVAACQGLRPWILSADPQGPVSPDAGAEPAHEPPRPVAAPWHPPVAAGADDPCAGDAPDPGPPALDTRVETVTVTIRTGPGEWDGTTDGSVELCLGVHCFPLAQGPHDPLGRDAVGVWTFEGLDLPRDELEAVELAVTDGIDRWVPATMDLRFDGDPVYCAALGAPWIGTDAGELARWTDPAGLHQDCTSAWDDRVLTHGPTVMAVGPDHANVWVRTDATRPVAVRVHPADDPAADRVAGWVYPSPTDDLTGVVLVGCLEPLTTYAYEVWVDGALEAAHTFATAPADGAPGVFTLAFGSAATAPDQPVFGALAAHAPDLFAFAGDAHPGGSADLDAERGWWRWTLARAERASFLAATPSLATWGARDSGAERAFLEYHANPPAGRSAGVYFATRWGDVDLYFLDDRSWRGVDGTMLGPDQRGWLLDELGRSTATFKLVIGSSQWTLEGAGWSAFPAERDELFGALAGVPGVLLLSGEALRSELRTLDAPGYPLPEITSAPLAETPSAPCPTGSPELLACATGQDQWVTLAFDTTLADPQVIATIHGPDGGPTASAAWTRSALSP